MGRALAHIEKIENIRPIPNADKIEQVNVLGWNLIVKKGEFNEGSLCVYIEIDSRVDKDNPEFEFLEKNHYKIKTIKMRGAISQGIALPMSILPEDVKRRCKIGDDVTDILKIEKIDTDYADSNITDDNVVLNHRNKILKNKFIKKMMKYSWFRKIILSIFHKQDKKTKWPEWVSKTDETRIQNIPDILDTNRLFIETEKIDGTSATFTLKKDKKRFSYYVCSRNKVVNSLIDVKTKGELLGSSPYVYISNKLNMLDVLLKISDEMKVDAITIQGEIVGPKINGNKYRLDEYDFYAFNLITPSGKVNSCEARDILEKEANVKWVPIVNDQFILPKTVEEILEHVEGESTLANVEREGSVFRTFNNDTSFKCVSNKFLLKNNE